MTSFSSLFAEWSVLDTWIAVIGALCAAAASLLGTFLVLRRMSMMGDAISHAVLPGLALAFMITGSRSSWVMLVGAGVVGVLTVIFTEWIHRAGKVDQGASMGVVFTLLFAAGLILLRQAADHVDLDPGCVLYGAVETAPLDTVRLDTMVIPRAALVNGGALLMNALFVMLCYKELKISTFDPALATTLGISARLMHYVLMTLVAITTVAAFESVGSILVIAMFIVPPAAASLLSDRLGRVLLLGVALALVSAFLGHLGALVVPGWFGFPGVSTSSAGMMAVAAGMLFAAAALFAPRHGMLSKWGHRLALTMRITSEDLLGSLYRAEEEGHTATHAARVAEEVGSTGRIFNRLARRSLVRRGYSTWQAGRFRLTEKGRAKAAELVRSHRLWETYFDAHAQLPADHLHRLAEELEHITDTTLQRRLAESVGHPKQDPHGSPIPERESNSTEIPS